MRSFGLSQNILKQSIIHTHFPKCLLNAFWKVCMYYGLLQDILFVFTVLFQAMIQVVVDVHT